MTTVVARGDHFVEMRRGIWEKWKDSLKDRNGGNKHPLRTMEVGKAKNARFLGFLEISDEVS